MGVRSTRGEIVQVQGGHIVRSTGRKDRHSKVYTARGPRDRRVRLSAHTAIQFYDVQDRLGYDRPSKAVDWLIKKAKSAIDKLAELPPWHPTAANCNPNLEADQDAEYNRMAVAEHSESPEFNFQFHRQLIDTPSNSHSFIAAAIDPDGIPDTMKSLFPTTSAASSMNFQSYPAEDLGLSLHSFQDQSLIPGQSQPNNASHPPQNVQTLFSGLAPAGFESNFQRMADWGNDTGAGNRAPVGFTFNQAEPFPPRQPSLLGQGSAFSHRGTLQSSFMQSFRAWNDLPMASSDHNRTQELHPCLILGSRFAQEGVPGFSYIPAHIHGEEEQSVVSDRPSTSSLNSQQ